MTDIARLGYEIDSSQARTAAKDLDRLAAASQKVETGQKKLSAASRDMLRGSDGRFMSAADSAAKYGEEIDALRMKYNPLYAASKQFEAQQAELQRALALGAISVQQYDAALANMQRGMIAGAGTMDRFGASMQGAGHHTANMMFQFQDIGMMLAAGQSPLMLALQQGTQIVGIFKQMEGEGRSSFEAIKGGLMGLISPLSLVTIGVIAGGAALVQWGLSALGAGQNAQTFRDAIEQAQASIDELRAVTELYSSEGLTKLADKYGEVNAEVLALLENQRILAEQQALADVQAAVEAITAGLGEGMLNTKVWELADAFETSSDRARGLLDVMEGIADLPTLDRQLAVIESLKSELSAVTDGFKDMTPEQVKMLRLLTDAEDQMRQLAAAVPGGNWMDSAISGVQSLGEAIRARIGEALALNAALPGNGAGGVAKVYSGRGGDPRQFGANAGGSNTFNAENFSMPSGGGGGGGGGGGSDPYAANLERLVQSLRTEREVVDDWYNENLTILQDRRAQELLSEQEHKAALLALEQEYLDRKSKLSQGYDQFTLGSAEKLFGELYSLSGSQYEGLLRLQKSFGAAQALVNTYTAASQVLADPKLGFFAKFAAVARTIAAGLGLVNAIKGGGAGGAGRASGPTSATAAVRQEPERVTRVELIGEGWLVDMAESIMGQIYDATGRGRVIVSKAAM